MAEKGGGGSAMRSRHLWVALVIMFAIDMLNGFNYLYPNVPSVPPRALDLGTLFKEQPWSSLGLMPIAIYPFMTAVGFFMPATCCSASSCSPASQGDAYRDREAKACLRGFSRGPTPSLAAVFRRADLGRRVGAVRRSHVLLQELPQEVWQDIRRGTKAEDGGISHRWAFVGLIVSYVAVMAYGLYGDLPVWYMVLYTGLYLVFSFVLTRIRAQIGPPTHEFAFFGPNSFMNRFFGTQWLSDRQATFVTPGLRDHEPDPSDHPMPYQLEAMKMGSLNKLNQKSMFWSIATITVFRALHFLLLPAHPNLQTATGATAVRRALPQRHSRRQERGRPVGVTMTLFDSRS